MVNYSPAHPRPAALDHLLPPFIVWAIAAVCASAVASSLLLADAKPTHGVSVDAPHPMVRPLR